LYQWNDLSGAKDHLREGLERAELGGEPRAKLAGYLLEGRIALAEGRSEEAKQRLEQVRPIIEQMPYSSWTARFQRFQLELWLAQDRIRPAVMWANEMLKNGDLENRPESESARLAVTQALLLSRDSKTISQLRSYLDELLQLSRQQNRKGIQIESYALQSLVDWVLIDRSHAMENLEKALRLAEPEGYIQLFVNLGLSMGTLLQEADARNVLPDYVETILSAFSENSYLLGSVQGELPEQLTSREQEVLNLIAAGLTNQEIAAELIISPETVKKHASSVYQKLGVNNRTEAASKARDLNLLTP
jgi:LuxR family maltose regulon positive regulatory protein